ncbi:6329_t:CDS:1, partial [Acaulospora colombiana]
EVTSVGTRLNSEASHNIIVSIEDSLEVQGEKVLKQANEQLKDGEKYDAILCVAGGFALGNASSEGFNVHFSVQTLIMHVNIDIDLFL